MQKSVIDLDIFILLINLFIIHFLVGYDKIA